MCVLLMFCSTYNPVTLFDGLIALLVYFITTCLNFVLRNNSISVFLFLSGYKEIRLDGVLTKFANGSLTK